jgi:archaeal type IV pilus assembly protein PilA
MRGGVENKMKFITKLRRSKKAISPIFATLILIAIAVIAGIVVYMFTSGTIASMTGGGTAGQEKVAVAAVEPAVGTATVWAKSTGGTDVTIDGAIIKDSGGITLDVVTPTEGTTGSGLTLDADGTLNDLDVASSDLVSGEVYTITITSEKGGSFVSASFQVP